jgi:hypothetical protein
VTMGRRAVLAGIALLAAIVPPVASAAGDQPTTCTFSAVFTLAPGLSIEPNSGTFTSHGERGQITCEAGSGSFGAEGRYGTADPDACFASGEGTAIQSWTIQVGADRRHETNSITFTYGVLAAGGVVSGEFQGPRFSGTFEVTPTKGDCVTAPITEVSLNGKGTMRG